MKKLSILLILILTFTMVLTLTACDNPIPPEPSIRWEEEHYTYSISLQHDASNGIITTKDYDDKTFTDHYTLINYSGYDLIKPESVSGTLVTDLIKDGDNWQYTTTLNLQETFANDGDYATQIDQFVKGLTAEQSTDLLLTENEANNTITVTSNTVATVVFKNHYLQTPISSTKQSTGYYIGKTKQMFNSIDIECKYDESSAKVLGTIDGDNVDTTTALTGNYIDANQAMLYARSLDQSTAWETYGAMNVFSPELATLNANNVSLVQDNNILVDYDDGDHDYTTLNTLAVTLANNYASYYIHTNTKDMMAGGGSSVEGGIHNYTPVKFQSNIYVFVLDTFDQDMIDDIRYVDSEE